MFRLLGPGLVGAIFFVLWVYCLLDVIASDESLVRNLPKIPWLFLVLLFGPVGSVAWLALGRPMYAGWRPGDSENRASRTVRGPEDEVGYRPPPTRAPGTAPDDAAERLQRWEDDLARREGELRRQEGDDPT